jgi:hypothetical protein
LPAALLPRVHKPAVAAVVVAEATWEAALVAVTWAAALAAATWVALAEVTWQAWAETTLAVAVAFTTTASIAHITGHILGRIPATTNGKPFRKSPTGGFHRLDGLNWENWRMAKRQLYRVSQFTREVASNLSRA